MAKAVKKAKPKKDRGGKYDEKMAVKGSFLDIVKASVKHAENNSAKKPS
jgi:hypothetical protein